MDPQNLLFSRRKSPRSPLTLLEEMEAGLSVSAIDHFSLATSLSKKAICDAIGLNTRTLNRRSTLKLDEADKLYRLARIFALAISVLEDELDALNWLTQPKIALGNQVPLALLKTELGAREVETLLNRIEHGVYS